MGTFYSSMDVWGVSLGAWRLHYCNWSYWSHNSKISCSTYVGALEGKWDSPRDCIAKKGVHFPRLCMLRGMRVWLELLQDFCTLA